MFGQIKALTLYIRRHAQANRQINQLVKNGRSDPRKGQGEQHRLQLCQHRKRRVIGCHLQRAGNRQIVGCSSATQRRVNQNTRGQRTDDATKAMDCLLYTSRCV